MLPLATFILLYDNCLNVLLWTNKGSVKTKFNLAVNVIWRKTQLSFSIILWRRCIFEPLGGEVVTVTFWFNSFTLVEALIEKLFTVRLYLTGLKICNQSYQEQSTDETLNVKIGVWRKIYLFKIELFYRHRYENKCWRRVQNYVIIIFAYL